MRQLRAFLLRLFGLTSGSQSRRELDEELSAHLQFHIDDNIAAGLTPEEANRQARLALGGVEATCERIRERRGFPLAGWIAQDWRYAWRALRRAPGFTAAIILTLAVGSGANAAIFSIFNQALMRQLPVPTAEQLVNLSSPGPRGGRTSTSSTFTSDFVFSYPLFRDLERTQAAFSGIAGYREFAANASYQRQAWTTDGMLVSGSYFPVLGITPEVGRLLTLDDDRTSSHVTVLSDAFWRTRFNADARVLNERLVVNGAALTIVGVAPAEFVGTALEIRPQLFVPLTLAADMMPGLRSSGGDASLFQTNRQDHWLYLFARLKPGVSLEQAGRQMAGSFAALITDVEVPALQQNTLSPTAREQFKARRLTLEPGRQGQRPERGELDAVFVLLFAITAVVVLIACTNVANLLLARATARERDITIRLSLGASRARLVTQMLIESLLLAAAGGLLGLLLADWSLKGTAAFIAGSYAPLEFHVDARMLLFTLALVMVMTLVCGLSPALLTTRRDLVAGLRGGTADRASASRIRASLASAQLGLSLVLLVIAGLFLKSLINVSRVELGMNIAGVTTFRLSPELNGLSLKQSRAYFERIAEAVGRLPGITSLTTATIRVQSGSRGGTNVTVEGFRPEPGDNTASDAADIGPNFFRTFKIPLLAGRDFTDADILGAPRVAMVNQAFARKFHLGGIVVGKRMRPGAGQRPPDIEIVGLVADARYSQAKDPIQPQFFLPAAQNPRLGALNFYMRSAQPTERLVPVIRDAVQKIDPTIPIENLRSVATQAGEVVMLDRLVTTLAIGFGVVSSLLAAIGLYGVLAYNLAQRWREFGVRIALGANVYRIWGVVFGYVGRIALAGLLSGIIAAIAAGRLAAAQFFEVPGYDVGVTIAAVAALGMVAAAAGSIPAWRASRINPMESLRSE